MKREDITHIFEGATDEQINAIMAINGADINREQEKARGSADKLRADLDAANATIQTLEANQSDAQALQNEIDRYKKADAERKAAEQRAAEQAILQQRFDAVTGDRKFIHDLVRKGVMEDFGRAIADKTNLGKSDAEVFAALVKDQNYFVNQNAVRVNMPQMGNPRPAEVKDRASLLKLPFAEQMKFKAEHPAEFAQILNP